MGDADGGYSGAGLKMLTEDLRRAVIRCDFCARGDELPDIDGILDRIEASPKTRINPLTGEARPLKRVILSPTYRK